MPSINRGATEEIRVEMQIESSPSPSDGTQGTGAQGQRRYKFSERCEIAADLANKLEKVQRLPIVKDARLVDLVAKFQDFPWAQDTMMATHQLEDVLVSLLWRGLGIPGETLQQ